MKKAKQVIVGIIDVVVILALLVLVVGIFYVQITTNPLATIISLFMIGWFIYFIKRGIDKAGEHLEEEVKAKEKDME